MVNTCGANEQRSSQNQRSLDARWGFFGTLLLALLTAVPLLVAISGEVYANEDKRVTVESRMMLANHWRLSLWSDGSTMCDIYIAHEGQPTKQEIIDSCGSEVYQNWSSTPSCNAAADGGDISLCQGMFIGYRGKEEHLVNVLVELPRAKVRVETVNCDPWSWCGDRTLMKFTGEEPLQGYHITSVHVRIGSTEKKCDQVTCELRMPITDANGVWVEYWAVSDYGDESERAFFLLRNVPDENSADLYRLDVLGADLDTEAPAGVVLWNVLPSLDHPDAPALEQPLSAGYLATTNRYLYLAGHLIQSGMVDGTGCSGYGLLQNRTANPCGEKLAAEKVLEWQNRYDQQIYTAALKYNVPARLLKGIIAQETQFWPYPVAPFEHGLGRITENGADMLLTWNIPIYLEACLSLYSDDRCSSGYSSLDPAEQAMLRGKVLSAVGTERELDLLGATLLASAQQTNQMIKNTTGQPVSAMTTYEEMWKLTVANYHAGSGCVGTAMQTTYDYESDMTWDGISQNLLGDCQGAIGYVEAVFTLAK
jgi:hypothetical protein